MEKKKYASPVIKVIRYEDMTEAEREIYSRILKSIN